MYVHITCFCGFFFSFICIISLTQNTYNGTIKWNGRVTEININNMLLSPNLKNLKLFWHLGQLNWSVDYYLHNLSLCFILKQWLNYVLFAIPICYRILYGKMLSKTGPNTQGKGGGAVRRNIILRFLAGSQSETEMDVFMELVMQPCQHLIQGTVTHYIGFAENCRKVTLLY